MVSAHSLDGQNLLPLGVHIYASDHWEDVCAAPLKKKLKKIVLLLRETWINSYTKNIVASSDTLNFEYWSVKRVETIGVKIKRNEKQKLIFFTIKKGSKMKKYI